MYRRGGGSDRPGGGRGGAGAAGAGGRDLPAVVSADHPVAGDGDRQRHHPRARHAGQPHRTGQGLELRC